jgi:hypothetical protein
MPTAMRAALVHAAQQHAASALALLKVVRAHLGGHASGHLAHGGEQRQGAVGQGHGLVGDAGGARVKQGTGQGLGSGQMQVGEEDKILAQVAELGLQRLLDLDDHLRAPGLGCGDHFGSGGGVFLVAQAAAQTGTGLYQQGVALAHQGFDRAGGHGDAILQCFDFLGNTDDHDRLLGVEISSALRRVMR